MPFNFSKEYNREDFLDFLQNEFLPNDLGIQDEEIIVDKQFQKIKKVTKLGKIKLLGKNSNQILSVYEIKHESEFDPRVSLTKEAFWIMRNDSTQRALIIFYSEKSKNYRFSLMTVDLVAKGRRVEKEYSNPRRYSFYLGPDAKIHTPTKYLMQKGKIQNFEDLHSRFDIEVVTKDFFEEFRHYFEKTKKEFEKANRNTICSWLKNRYTDKEYVEQINKFAYIFLGRIIFIYFLQRKGWIENETNYLRKFIENKNNTLLYTNFFQPLFFGVLCKKENERSLIIRKQYKDTPYLNGGLFEKSELENQLEESGKFIIFEDNFIREIILNFFEIYNFTINENLPNDQEVSIDPEMLGKIFENTLAEEERGEKGTFYTPREIVHFMVKESLLQFLKNETNIDQLKLHGLVYEKKSIENLRLSKEDVRLIDKKLENIKILDPAVGSAAFPVEMMQALVDLRKELNVNIGENINEVLLKKKFIKENLYGVDIDPGAIEVAKLRLWLALIVDYEKSEAELLPNLDFKFRLGNSLQEKIDDIDIFNNVSGRDLFSSMSKFEEIKDKMIAIKNKFYISDDEDKKRKLKKEFDDLEHKLIQAALDKYENQLESHISNVDALVEGYKNKKIQEEINKDFEKIDSLKQKIKDGTYKLFKPDFHFSEVFDRKDKQGNKIGGFDIVIGNPPYGVKVEDDIKEWHGLGSKDSYGVFISTALKRFLKPGGVLSYIVSDTWLTIKTHKSLREQVLAKQLHKIVRIHQDCFKATVNSCVMSLTNSPDNNYKLITADLTNISTRKETEEVRNKLYHLTNFIGQSTPKFAVYEYDQDLIKINSNIPFFVGSPKLFLLMNDINCQKIEKEIGEKEKRKIKIRQIELNGKIIELLKFSEICESHHGISTGNNSNHIYYLGLGERVLLRADRNLILSNKEIKKLSKKQKLEGFNKKDFDGKFLVPLDKGGASDVDKGFLPNYYIPTDYYIDWSSESILKMRENKGFAWKNSEFFFKEGITFSLTGIYAPTFRFNSESVFEHNGSCIFSRLFTTIFLMQFLPSKLFKYLVKNYDNHSVVSSNFDNSVIPTKLNAKIIDLINAIIAKQKQNSRYDYMSNEQKEIDKLVYGMYGLNKEDILEVECWYARRYPKLARYCDTDNKAKTATETIYGASQEYKKRFMIMSDEQLIEAFNHEVGNRGWSNSRSLYLSALHDEFENRNYDYSDIGELGALSFKNRVKIIGKKILIDISRNK